MEASAYMIAAQKGRLVKIPTFEYEFKHLNDDDKHISGAIDNTLDKLFNRTHLGFHYITAAVKICLDNNSSVRNFSEEIYDPLARFYNSSIDAVERSIRFAIRRSSINIESSINNLSIKTYRQSNRAVIFKITKQISLII